MLSALILQPGNAEPVLQAQRWDGSSRRTQQRHWGWWKPSTQVLCLHSSGAVFWDAVARTWLHLHPFSFMATFLLFFLWLHTSVYQYLLKLWDETPPGLVLGTGGAPVGLQTHLESSGAVWSSEPGGAAVCFRSYSECSSASSPPAQECCQRGPQRRHQDTWRAGASLLRAG